MGMCKVCNSEIVRAWPAPDLGSFLMPRPSEMCRVYKKVSRILTPGLSTRQTSHDAVAGGGGLLDAAGEPDDSKRRVSDGLINFDVD